MQKKLKTEVEIGSISFGLTGRIKLNNIYVEDQAKDTLVSGGNITANVTLSKLFANEVEVKDIALDKITAKIKRVLPDTVFNFQFIVDAFATEKTKDADTAQTAPLKLDVYRLDVTNSYFAYKDVITGNDMKLKIGQLSARLDTLDIYQLNFSVPSVDLSDVAINFNQTTPLVKPNPESVDMAEAAEPITMRLNFGTINLNRVKVDYNNVISSFYTNLNIGKLNTKGKTFDLQKQVVHLANLELDNTFVFVGSANKEQAEAAVEQVGQEIKAQATQKNWDIRVDELELNNNKIKYDDSTRPQLSRGIDYAHLEADSLTLHMQNLVFNTDSMGGQITKGYVREKSGFGIDQLEGDILYSSNQTYVKNFLLKTPGSELKREVLFNYSSHKAFTDSFQNTQMEIDIPDSYILVKDILVFAPQLRSQPALSNPNDVWHLNIKASGNLNSLRISALQFDGLNNTQVDLEGSLAGLTNPASAGGNITIRKFHTSQSDIALFTGTRLSTPDINIPETFDIRGTINGYAARLRTNLIINSSAGDLAMNGSLGTWLILILHPTMLQ